MWAGSALYGAARSNHLPGREAVLPRVLLVLMAAAYFTPRPTKKVSRTEPLATPSGKRKAKPSAASEVAESAASEVSPSGGVLGAALTALGCACEGQAPLPESVRAMAASRFFSLVADQSTGTTPAIHAWLEQVPFFSLIHTLSLHFFFF